MEMAWGPRIKDIPPRTENQMEKKRENEMDTGMM